MKVVVYAATSDLLRRVHHSGRMGVLARCASDTPARLRCTGLNFQHRKFDGRVRAANHRRGDPLKRQAAAFALSAVRRSVQLMTILSLRCC
jgi:hypothetical protein